jgi:phosphonate transport system permease protein
MSESVSAPPTVSGVSQIEIPAKPLSQRLRAWLFWIAAAALLAWSWAPTEMFRSVSLFTDWHNMAEFAAGYTRPNFHEWRSYVSDMIITVQIALWGTALAVAFAIPFSILCSANICPQWIVQPTRRLMDTFRAINEILFALFFVVAVGLGPFAGVMALFVHNVGVIAKLFSESVEAIDPRPVEGIRATGASRLREVIFGVFPQVAPLWASLTLYRLETNVRSATTLGIVGAGGIGQTLYESIRSFLYSETAAQIIIVIVTVVFIDLLSARLRKGLL